MSFVAPMKYLIIKEYDYPNERIEVFKTLEESCGQPAPSFGLFDTYPEVLESLPDDIDDNCYFRVAQIIDEPVSLGPRRGIYHGDIEFSDNHDENVSRLDSAIRRRAISKLNISERRVLGIK